MWMQIFSLLGKHGNSWFCFAFHYFNSWFATTKHWSISFDVSLDLIYMQLLRDFSSIMLNRKVKQILMNLLHYRFDSSLVYNILFIKKLFYNKQYQDSP